MKAVVLVGGEGTRLRPLTETVPKPLLPLVDRPILAHVLDHLVAHGVAEVVMSSPYLEETFHPFLETRGDRPAVTWVTEREPLGTGGAIVSVLDRLGDEPFLALNGDILTDLDLTAMLDRHRSRGAAVTIALHRVEDARAFGLVATDPTGRVTGFWEKPPDPIPGDINAGTYVLDPSVLRGWDPETYVWIEGEIFPSLIAEGMPIHGFGSDAYWLDLGTPEQYLRAHADLLAGRVAGHAYDAPWIGAGARVDPSARVGRSVAIGPDARVEAGAEVDASVLLTGSVVEGGARVVGSVLGSGATVGVGASLAGSVLGDGVRVGPGASLDGVRLGADATRP
ncbi:MAG TPA: NDP-sugar synthase [Actinomycetota bacterium]|nr:NDP-sugar synthase [Actinomycetota bacterium]